MLDLLLRTTRNPQVDQEYPGSSTLSVFAEGENDLILGTNGDFSVLDGTQRLSQDITKILITQRGTNAELPLYGANIQSLIGQKLDPQVLQGQLLAEVKDALLILQALNQTNPDLDQQIGILQSIQVDVSSSTQLTVSLTVITVSGKKVGATAVIQ